MDEIYIGLPAAIKAMTDQHLRKYLNDLIATLKTLPKESVITEIETDYAIELATAEIEYRRKQATHDDTNATS